MNKDRMGFDLGLNNPGTRFKTKFRWLFTIPGIIGQDASIENNVTQSIEAIPPLGFSRPSLLFKSETAEHITESIDIPMKAEFKDIELTLIDIRRPGTSKNHPIIEWIERIHSMKQGNFKYPVDTQFYQEGKLGIYDGKGCNLELWVLESCWPKSADFGQLNMADSEILTVDITLSFHRAYLQKENNQNEGFIGDINPEGVNGLS